KPSSCSCATAVSLASRRGRVIVTNSRPRRSRGADTSPEPSPVSTRTTPADGVSMASTWQTILPTKGGHIVAQLRWWTRMRVSVHWIGGERRMSDRRGAYLACPACGGAMVEWREGDDDDFYCE